jgi:hypothetical protein
MKGLTGVGLLIAIIPFAMISLPVAPSLLGLLSRILLRSVQADENCIDRQSRRIGWSAKDARRQKALARLRRSCRMSGGASQ